MKRTYEIPVIVHREPLAAIVADNLSADFE